MVFSSSLHLKLFYQCWNRKGITSLWSGSKQQTKTNSVLTENQEFKIDNNDADDSSHI